MITLSLICFNEAENLKRCLKSAEDFVDEVIVVDLGSSDNSIEVAKKFGAKVFGHQFVPFVELTRDYAISKANGDWILILDPDEEIGENLKVKLKEIAKQGKFVAVNIPGKNIFFGRWISHTNWWPDRHIRFFKKGKVRWSERIHSYPKVEGEILQLPANPDLAITHYGYDNLNQFIDRQNRYSEVEAEQKFQDGERFSWTKFFWWPTREFLARFIKHAGFLDCFCGFALTFLMMVYKLEILIKLWEKEQKR